MDMKQWTEMRNNMQFEDSSNSAAEGEGVPERQQRLRKEQKEKEAKKKKSNKKQ